MELEKLIQRLEADTSQFHTALRQARGELVQTDRQSERMARSFRSNFDVAGRSVLAFRNILAGLGVALSVREVLGFADAFTRVQNSLRVTGTSTEQLTDRTRQLFDIANRTRQPIEAISQLYQRASIAATELGISNQELLAFVETTGQALALQGISAEQASGALLQLAQSLGSGIVRAEEFNSILEGAFPIALAAARGIDEAGGSVARLRQLVVEGEISSQEFFRGIQRGSAEIGEGFSRANITIAQAITNLRNSMIEFVGETDQAGGGTRRLAGAINDLATAMRDPVFKEFVDRELAQLVRDFGNFARAALDLAGAIGETSSALGDFVEQLSGLSLTTPGNLLQNTTREFETLTRVLETLNQGGSTADALSELFKSAEPVARIAEIIDEISLLETRLNELPDRTSPQVDAITHRIIALREEMSTLQRSASFRGAQDVGVHPPPVVDIFGGRAAPAQQTPTPAAQPAAEKRDLEDIIRLMEREAALLRDIGLTREAISAIMGAEGALERELTAAEQERLVGAVAVLEALDKQRDAMEATAKAAKEIELPPETVEFLRAGRELAVGIEESRLVLGAGGRETEETRVQRRLLDLRGSGLTEGQIADLEPQIREFERLGAQIRLVDNVADEMSETIASGLIEGIAEGEAFIDVLERIGLSLAAVAAQAVLETGIRTLVGTALGAAFLGAGAGGTTAPTTTGTGGAGFALPFYGGPRQHGGPVSAGQMYRVGEAGAEWFVPRTDGMIVPRGAAAAERSGQPIVVETGANVVVNDHRALPFAEPARVSQRTGIDGRPVIDVMISDSLSRLHQGGQLDALGQKRGVRRS